MENKINIAELLKDCPKGMELYSPIFGKVYLDKIRPHLAIVVTTDKEQGDFKEEFLYDGRYGMNGECMLFPSKGKTTWEGFQRPFKDGDVIANDYCIAIFHNAGKPKHCVNSNVVYYHCQYNNIYNNFKAKIDYGIGVIEEYKFATEEEKAKLFQTIKDNGYKWNAKTKTLEKLVEPKFKVGDTIQDEDGYKVKIAEVNLEDECYGYESMIAKGIGGFAFSEQNNWELVPNKFDISTLKPFESKVLVRDYKSDCWRPAIFGFTIKTENVSFCVEGGNFFNKCIPYESNEHLLGTRDDCDEYYKTWE